MFWYHLVLSLLGLCREGVNDWGNFGVMPIRSVPTAALVSNSWYHSPFSHDTESASPGYYTVHLDAWNTTAELLAAGTHAGIHRYVCHGAGPCGVLIDACHSVESTTSNTCKNASISVAVSPTGAGTITGWVRMAGGLSGTSLASQLAWRVCVVMPLLHFSVRTIPAGWR